ncbi:MAG: DAK2 domain-containing protein [Actinobacteria bacterium]|nr:DAK2 domain-containing protein [Actinomycetota bacterium]
MAVKVAFVVAAAHAALKAQAARINALNVYPVPDGDTGTNMLLTLEAVREETSDKAYDTPEAASKAGARAALMGARGNSGVILSQMIRGACEALAQHTSFTAAAFAAALEGARDRAYASIRQPVEGTMLTVIKDAARAARETLEDKNADLPTVVRAAGGEAHASVRRTPELLGVLREAGVVDAGGLGVAVILDGIYAGLTGKKIEVPEDEEEGGTPDLDAIHAEEEAWGYCTEFVVTDFSGDALEFEERIHSSGRSVLVVADDDVVKVHLHTQDPGGALSYAGGFGRLTGVKIDDMEAQVRSRADASENVAAEETSKQLDVVAASRGEGNREMFESMGAVVIEGGQGANPSAADFARAVEGTGAESVVLLPNNKNIVPTAEQVEELVWAGVHVVPTTTIAAGLATMVGFDAEGEPEEVVEEMREIAGALKSAEITRAVRAARIGDREVPEGAYMGLLDGELFAVQDSVEDAALTLAEEMLEEADVLMLLRGEELDEATLQRIADDIRDLDAAVDVETRDGGQPLYPLQMVAE